MTEEFVASNGIRIRYGEYKGYFFATKHGDHYEEVGHYAAGSLVDAAMAEYYRAKEDERLGRWRWPEYPEYVVYAPRDFTHYVRVLDESGAVWDVVYREGVEDRGSLTAQAAHAYFDAHPEPKPWHDAKPGEVWLLTFREGTLHEGSYVSGDWSFIAADHAVPHDDPRITSARKIWPQDEPTIDDLSYDA